MHRVGVDLGGTKIEAVVAAGCGDGALKVVWRRRIPTPGAEDGAAAADCDSSRGSVGCGGGSQYGRIVDSVATLAGEALAEADEAAGAQGRGLPPVGVCAPGSLLPGSQLVANSNTRCLAGRPFGLDLERALGRRVLVENDANCFALAEAALGAGRGHRTVFGVIMGTGVGGGLVIGGRIHGGRSGMAGEWGHHTLHPCGRPCYCGRQGCAEAYLSGPALEARWAELAAPAAAGPAPAPGAPLAPPGAPLAEISSSLDAAAESGRPLPPHAEQWRGELVADFGSGLANVVNILDPDAIVVGGGVSNMGLLYGDGARAVHERLFRDPGAPHARPAPILRNELGDSAGALGACMLEATAARSSPAAC